MPASADGHRGAALLAALLLAAPAPVAAAPPLFTDVTAEAGIPALRFAEGVNAVDLTGDGLPDLLLPNGRGPARLLVNEGGLRFRDATDRLVPQPENVVGAVVADLTGDGRPDLVLVRGNYAGGGNLFYVAGPGPLEFRETAAEAGIAAAGNGIAAAVADVDRDGRLDLLVSTWSGARLFRNASAPGVVRFEEVSADAGLAGEGRGWGAVFADLTGDHLPDLFLARGTKGRPDPSRLFVNEGGGRFRDATAASGLTGIRWGTGGVPADFDGDGALDLLVTDLEGRDRIFRNDDAGGFVDVTASSGIASGKSHGAAAGDIDGDLRPDIVIGGFGEPLRAYRNLGGMRFAEVTATWGLQGTTRNFGAVLADLDRDGDLDLYVANADGRNRLYRNGLAEGGSMTTVTVRLAGLPLGGIGAEVRLRAAGDGASPLARIDCLGGVGYCSQGPPEVLFSLPAHPCAVEITLPGGGRTTIPVVRPGVIDATLPAQEATP